MYIYFAHEFSKEHIFFFQNKTRVIYYLKLALKLELNLIFLLFQRISLDSYANYETFSRGLK